MMRKPWEVPFHPAQFVTDMITMMDPRWQMQAMDPNRLIDMARSIASSDLDPRQIVAFWHDMMDGAVRANLTVAAMPVEITLSALEAAIAQVGQSPDTAYTRITLANLTMARDILVAAGKLTQPPA